MHGVVASLQDHALPWIHAARFSGGESEELVIEELQAINETAVPAVAFTLQPPISVLLNFVRSVHLAMVPAADRNFFSIVRAHVERHCPRFVAVGARISNASSAHLDSLCHVALVAADKFPMSWQTWSLRVIIFVLVSDRLHTVEGILIKCSSCWGHHIDLVHLVLALVSVTLIEACHAVGSSTGLESVRQKIRTENHEGPRLSRHLGDIRFTIEGAELQRTLFRAQEPDAHELVVHENS
mmetsp:Transcript_84231/g.146274  ORF Transcript_84231/g.146274 Transcript_84231/m.146274 type:complete len:240 (+) Transcript_84231:2428-3147(+)